MSVFKDFPGLENLKKNSRTFKDRQEPWLQLLSMSIAMMTIKLKNEDNDQTDDDKQSQDNSIDNDCH